MYNVQLHTYTLITLQNKNRKPTDFPEELVHKKCLQVASQETQSIRVGEDVIPVETDLGFSKFGQMYSIATVQLKSQTYSETGETVNEAVNKLATKLSQGNGMNKNE